jgi:acyl carrier protein
MDDADIKERVARLVRETVPGSENCNLTEDFALLGEDGAFDSVTALQLLLALENEFGIVMKDDDVQPENLRNLERIVKFVKAALSRGS